MEDFVTWVDSSKIKQHVLNYNEEVSDFTGSIRCTVEVKDAVVSK